MSNFKPREFIPGVQPKIDLFSTITIYGKRRTGKTVWAKWFVQAYRQYFPWAWVFTKTAQNCHYATFVPKKFIIPEFDASVLDKIMERQQKAEEAYLEDPNIDPRAIIFWDDYSGNDIRFNTKLSEYYWTGRHYLTLNFFCAQHVTLTPPSIRSNTDLVVIFNSDYADSIEEYWKCFAGKIEKKAFVMFMEEYLDKTPHGFVAILNDPNCPPEEKYYYGVADVIDVELDSILGCQEYWAGSEKQLEEISNGKMKHKIELIKKLSEPDSPPPNRRIKKK